MRLTLLNQFYAPDISPTAQLAASLAEHRAASGDRVTVITGRAGYLEGLGTRSPRPSGVRVLRAWTPDLGKASIGRRLVGYVTYLLGAAVRVAALPRQDVIVVMTTPPLVMLVALVHKVLHPSTRVVLWSMDCYPDVAERFGEIKVGGPVSRVLRWLTRVAFRRLDHVIALDGAMAKLLTEQYAAEAGRPPCTVVPNWEPAGLFPELASSTSATASGSDGVTVLYLGNIGVGHRFDTVVDAAAVLGTEARFSFVGGGARRDALLDAVGEHRLTNVSVRGYVPKTATPDLLAGADAALITLDERSLGVISPSKLHANLAAGLPVLYVGPEGSNVDEAIDRFGCGWSLREGDVTGFVTAIRTLQAEAGTPLATERRSRSRAAFEQAYCDTVVLLRVDAILDRSG